jgi:hypothetical protein
MTRQLFEDLILEGSHQGDETLQFAISSPPKEATLQKGFQKQSGIVDHPKKGDGDSSSVSSLNSKSEHSSSSSEEGTDKSDGA